MLAGTGAQAFSASRGVPLRRLKGNPEIVLGALTDTTGFGTASR